MCGALLSYLICVFSQEPYVPSSHVLEDHGEIMKGSPCSLYLMVEIPDMIPICYYPYWKFSVCLNH